MVIRRLIFNYIFVFATLFLLYILVHLAVNILRSRKRLNLFLLDIKQWKEESFNSFIIKQNSIFIIWLTLLKLLGVFLPLLINIRIINSLVNYFDSVAATGVPLDLMLIASGMGQFLIVCEIGLILAIFPWLLYFIFSYILQKRILTLRRIQEEMKMKNVNG